MRDFFPSLVKKPLEDYDDLLRREEKYINVKEAQSTRKNDLEMAGLGASQLERWVTHLTS